MPFGTLNACAGHFPGSAATRRRFKRRDMSRRFKRGHVRALRRNAQAVRVRIAAPLGQYQCMTQSTVKIGGAWLLAVLLFSGCSRSGDGPRTTSVTPDIKGQLIGPAQLVDAGNTTPEAALESGFWAQAKGDYDAVMASTEPQTQEEAKAWLGDKATFQARSQAEFASFQGVQILARKNMASDRVELKYQFAFQNRPVPQITKIIQMVKIRGAWRGGHTRGYDASWDEGSQLEARK